MLGSLTALQVVGLVLACLVAGAALLLLLLASINSACDPDASETSGCGVIAVTLLAGAVAFAAWVVSA